ncbi:hypothetical protein [Borrelia miyamotoi]|uniref:hypothetical protein n=1 Tax=Borrelia miyamotoi TaxID=47466 RepID=UPI0004B3C459|nr:hypothetical protein [Borrelia miyamotoi]
MNIINYRLSLLSILNDFSVSRVSLDINSFSSKFLGIMDGFRVPVKNVNIILARMQFKDKFIQFNKVTIIR